MVLDPSNAVFYGHWVATIPWVWVLAGLSGVAVFAASRAGAVPRWIGIGGLGVGGLTLLLGISPLQYMAGMTGPIWLLATALHFRTGFAPDRAFRSGDGTTRSPPVAGSAPSGPGRLQNVRVPPPETMRQRGARSRFRWPVSRASP